MTVPSILTQEIVIVPTSSSTFIYNFIDSSAFGKYTEQASTNQEQVEVKTHLLMHIFLEVYAKRHFSHSFQW